MSTDNPVLDTLTDMTAASVEHNSLSPREFMISRLAAMVAVDAPPISYFVSASAIEESGLTAEDIQGVMIAVAPVTGAPRVMSSRRAHPARSRHRRRGGRVRNGRRRQRTITNETEHHAR